MVPHSNLRNATGALRLVKDLARHRLRWAKASYGQRRKRFVMDELVFFVTNRCNLRCWTCFYAHTMEASAGGDDELTLSEISKVSRSLGSLGNLLLSGGEPFLRDDMADLCELFHRQNRVRHIHLPTNGTLTETIERTTRRILERCPSLYLTIGLSLDGVGEGHDAIKGTKGCFAGVVETAKTLAEIRKGHDHLNVEVITVVSSANIDEIIPLADFVKHKLPVNRHGPSPLRGRPRDASLAVPSRRQWEGLAGPLLEYERYWNARTAPSALEGAAATRRARRLYEIYGRVLGGEPLPFPCRAGDVIGVLEAKGDVRLCELTGVVGNVRRTGLDFKAAWFSEKAERMRGSIPGCACTHACFLGPSMRLHWSDLKGLFL